MNNSKKTAASEYTQKAANAQDLLKRIATRLSEHQTRQAGASDDWGFVGDLGHVNEQLALVLASLGDRSGVDELGLSY